MNPELFGQLRIPFIEEKNLKLNIIMETKIVTKIVKVCTIPDYVELTFNGDLFNVKLKNDFILKVKSRVKLMAEWYVDRLVKEDKFTIKRMIEIGKELKAEKNKNKEVTKDMFSMDLLTPKLFKDIDGIYLVEKKDGEDYYSINYNYGAKHAKLYDIEYPKSKKILSTEVAMYKSYIKDVYSDPTKTNEGYNVITVEQPVNKISDEPKKLRGTYNKKPKVVQEEKLNFTETVDDDMTSKVEPEIVKTKEYIAYPLNKRTAEITLPQTETNVETIVETVDIELTKFKALQARVLNYNETKNKINEKYDKLKDKELKELDDDIIAYNYIIKYL